jgi:hypothetical protein
VEVCSDPSLPTPGGVIALTLLDDIAPTYDVSSRHTIWIAASPAEVYEVARRADLGRPWMVRVLMGLRIVPAVLARVAKGHRTPLDPRQNKPVRRLAFTVIGESVGEEFVLGIMGRFWTPTGRLVANSAEQFRQPPPAGLAQAMWNFRVEASGAGTTLSTETRVRCADPETRRQFMRYWRVVRLGSGLIRGSILRYIRSEGERRHRYAIPRRSGTK